MGNKFVYLAGPISGQTERECRAWRSLLIDMYDRQTAKSFEAPVVFLDPLRRVRPVYPGKPFGEAVWPATIDNGMMRDLRDIERSDVVVFGGLESAKKVSIGSMIEWGYAKALGKKIMLLADYEVLAYSPHAHPWLNAHDFHATTVHEAVSILEFYFADHELPDYEPGVSKYGISPPPLDAGEAQPNPVPVHSVGDRVGSVLPDPTKIYPLHGPVAAERAREEVLRAAGELAPRKEPAPFDEGKWHEGQRPEGYWDDAAQKWITTAKAR